jgi:hypothetical protein
MTASSAQPTLVSYRCCGKPQWSVRVNSTAALQLGRTAALGRMCRSRLGDAGLTVPTSICRLALVLHLPLSALREPHRPRSPLQRSLAVRCKAFAAKLVPIGRNALAPSSLPPACLPLLHVHSQEISDRSTDHCANPRQSRR